MSRSPEAVEVGATPSAFRAICGADARRTPSSALGSACTLARAEGSGQPPSRRSLPLKSPDHDPPRRVATARAEAQLETIWDDIRDELRGQVPDFKFHIWLEPLELAALVGRTLYVRAPEHIRTSVAERYLPLLRDARRGGAARDTSTVEVVGRRLVPATTPRLRGAAAVDAPTTRA